MPNIFFQPELDLRDVVETTIFTIRHAADQIRQFDHGAIALRFVPKCDSAYDWLGCYRDKKDGDTDVDFVYSVKPGESKTRLAGGVTPTTWRWPALAMPCRKSRVALAP